MVVGGTAGTGLAVAEAAAREGADVSRCRSGGAGSPRALRRRTSA